MIDELAAGDFAPCACGWAHAVRRREAGQREHEDRDLLPDKPRGAAVHGKHAGGAWPGDRAVRRELLQRLCHAGLLLASEYVIKGSILLTLKIVQCRRS